ncbi:MAG TPA: carbohydrate porin [Candidatus Methylacidiphilales bacterium]|nr:carbohydrate porin [Candidatus Methylacidiphilales bacterium]
MLCLLVIADFSLADTTTNRKEGTSATGTPEIFQEPESSYWSQPYMLGDWGGERTKLANEGIVFFLNNIGDLQSDVTGSQTHHVTYNGRFRGITDINFEKLANFDGEFFFTGIWQYGENNTVQYPLGGGAFGTPYHVNTFTSSVGGKGSERIDQLWYQQGFADSMFKVKLGQVAASSEFGATDFYDIFVNDEIAYAPDALYNIRQPFSPAGKPGIILWGDLSDLTKGLYVKTGAFTAYDNPYSLDSNGIYYYDDFNHGMTAAFEVGYNEPNTAYPGLYKAGLNANELSYTNPYTGKHYWGDYNAYAVWEKTVYHPTGADGKPQTAKGLDLVSEFIGAPGDRNPLQYEITAGCRYTGLIPGRDADKANFGIIYSDVGTAYSSAYRTVYGHGLGGEIDMELGYQYNATPWFGIQPNLQDIINPQGDTQRAEILIIGLRTIVQF